MAALLGAVPSAAEKPVPSLREITRSPMIEGLDALKASDYPKARAGFLAAQAMLDQRSLKSDTYEDRAIRAAVAYLTAKATGEGKLGNPCPILKRARSLVDGAAEIAAKQPGIDHMREVGSEAETDIAAANVKFGCTKAPPAPKGTIPATLAGHYYLSGVRETGSELRLWPDGSYEYFMSYGAVDQFSRGTWQKVGDAVVLTHTKTPSGGPLFKLDSLEPWDVDAEAYIQNARHEGRIKAVEATCPFLAEPDISDATVPPPAFAVTMPPVSDGEAPKIDYALVYGRAKVTEAQSRRAYERAAQAAMAPGNNNVTRHDTARGMRYDWQSALDALQSARNRADSNEALPKPPVLPAKCQLPQAVETRDLAQKEWVRGFGVIVGDPEVGLKFSNVSVRFHFADGQVTDLKTQRRGFAWVEKRLGIPVTAISLSYQRAIGPQPSFERFAIANGADGVQRVIIDSRQLVDPPFDEMRLRIEDDGLSGPRDRGRYTKRD
jgi:hypothetical protein